MSGDCPRGLQTGWFLSVLRMCCVVVVYGPLASRSARARRLTSFIPTIHSTALSHYPIRIRFTRFIALCVVVQPFISPLEAAASDRPCFYTRLVPPRARMFCIAHTGNGYLRDPSSTAHTTAHMQGERVSSNATREKWAECARVHGARARPDYSASASTPRGIYGRRAAARCTLAT